MKSSNRRTLILIIASISVFVGILSTQFLWTRASQKRQIDQLRIRIYDVLDRTVELVQSVNNAQYLNAVQTKLKEAADTANPERNLSAYLSYVLNEIPTGESGFELPSTMSSVQSQVISESFFADAIATLGIDNMKDHESDDNPTEMSMMEMIRELDPQNLPTEQRLSNFNLTSHVGFLLSQYDIDLPFTLEVLKREELNSRMNKNHFLCFVELFPYDLVKKDVYLAIDLEDIDSYKMIGSLWILLLSLICTIGLFVVMAISIVTISQQQKLSEIKDDFLNNMTHELKTPIASISIATKLIEKEKVQNSPGLVKEYNAIIGKENERINLLVSRILTQAKLERKTFSFDMKEVRINELLNEANLHFSFMVKEMGGEFHVNIDPTEFTFICDKLHVYNAICNLIDNAIKYSPQNRIDISLSSHFEPGFYVVQISDKGIGIPKRAQEKIFDRFYRIPTGDVHNVKGFGLGLAYVKSIAEAHNITIHLDSSVNEGSTFKLYFPVE